MLYLQIAQMFPFKWIRMYCFIKQDKYSSNLVHSQTKHIITQVPTMFLQSMDQSQGTLFKVIRNINMGITWHFTTSFEISRFIRTPN